jgi:hypothetical protein
LRLCCGNSGATDRSGACESGVRIGDAHAERHYALAMPESARPPAAQANLPAWERVPDELLKLVGRESQSGRGL